MVILPILNLKLQNKTISCAKHCFRILNCTALPPFHHLFPFPFTCARCWHLLQLPSCPPWLPGHEHFGWCRFCDTIRVCGVWQRSLNRCIPLLRHDRWGVQWEEPKNWRLTGLDWIPIFSLNQHLTLQFSYHLGLSLLTCKERGTNIYLEGYWGIVRKWSIHIACLLPGWVLLINVFQCVVPGILALESLKIQILGVLYNSKL